MAKITIELIKKDEDKTFISIRNHLIDFFKSYYKKVLKEPMEDAWGGKAKKKFNEFLKKVKEIPPSGKKVRLEVYKNLELVLDFKRTNEPEKITRKLVYSIKFDLNYKTKKAERQRKAHKYLTEKRYIKPIDETWGAFLDSQSDKFDHTFITPNY
ncbi:MAG: hypothetical protein R6U26_00680 [Candidatus Undinarchaeales archaeon]